MILFYFLSFWALRLRWNGGVAFTSEFVANMFLHYDLVPFPINDLVIFQVLHRDGEVVSGLVVDDVPHHRAELDVLLDVFLRPSALQIVKKHLPVQRSIYFGLYLFGTLVEMKV